MSASNRLVAIAALFVTCLIAANTIGVKVIALGEVRLPAAIIVFPLSYIFGDILTEVYGYRWARRIIWLGFISNFIFVLLVYLGQLLPPAPSWGGQQAYETILGYTPRLVAASFCGYLAGEFSNSLIMARLKVKTQGRFLWVRTISSTIIGQGLDTALFITIGFIGTSSFSPLMILYHWLAKVAIEVVATPLTYLAVGNLKKLEKGEVFDTGTNFNPFSFS
jgi:hypothetical protein